jgi:hypothetical protein
VTAAVRPEALLIDFGGVLTTSVFDSFAAFCRVEGLPADALLAELEQVFGIALEAAA